MVQRWKPSALLLIRYGCETPQRLTKTPYRIADDTPATCSARLCFDCRAGLLQLLSAACGWNDTVHAQILDHLSVVIEAMRCGKRCQEQPRGWSATS